jgi:hypothetical protein
MSYTGVFACHKNQFKAGATGTMNSIADMESFDVSFDNGVEEWTPFNTEGWMRRLMTAKSVTISVKGKRNFGDAGNDYVAGKALVNGTDSEGDFEWTFPDGTKVLFSDAVFNVTACGSGESTNVGPLEFEVMSNGKPTVTPAV